MWERPRSSDSKPVRAPGGRRAGSRGAEAAFRSREALAIKEEIVRVGRKLWERQFVDGNGGNITCRLTDDWVICTPTLVSKGDLTVDDMCLVDLDGNQLAGTRGRSSEIFLHLEIFKAVAEAQAVIHCHPPHATAYAVAGVVPPTCMIAEHEVFIGPVALVPYETPGTMECARAVVPYVKDHNTILLANHGLVCWADTITHAEWYAEVMDTTCRILILASQPRRAAHPDSVRQDRRSARDQTEARDAGRPVRPAGVPAVRLAEAAGGHHDRAGSRRLGLLRHGC